MKLKIVDKNKKIIEVYDTKKNAFAVHDALKTYDQLLKFGESVELIGLERIKK